MCNLKEFFPIHAICHNEKCQYNYACRYFHAEYDVIVLTASRNKVIIMTEYNFILCNILHKNRGTVPANLSICPNKINNLGNCPNGESCLQLHDENDEITLICKYNKKPIIIHKYCYSIMPVLPIEIWQIIIKYCSQDSYINKTWTDFLFGLGKLSVNLCFTVELLLSDYSNVTHCHKIPEYFRIVFINECLNKINKWQKNNQIRQMIKYIEVIEYGYLAYSSENITPCQFEYGDIKTNFFATEYANKRILQTKICYDLFIDPDPEMNIRLFSYRSSYPTIVIPIVKPNKYIIYLLNHFSYEIDEDNGQWMIRKYVFTKDKSEKRVHTIILEETVINIIRYVKNETNVIPENLNSFIKIANETYDRKGIYLVL